MNLEESCDKDKLINDLDDRIKDCYEEIGKAKEKIQEEWKNIVVTVKQKIQLIYGNYIEFDVEYTDDEKEVLIPIRSTYFDNWKDDFGHTLSPEGDLCIPFKSFMRVCRKYMPVGLHMVLSCYLLNDEVYERMDAFPRSIEYIEIRPLDEDGPTFRQIFTIINPS